MGQLWHIYGAAMAYLWGSYGAAMKQLWRIYGASMGQLWHIYGAAMAYLWGSYGVSMGQPRRIYGAAVGRSLTHVDAAVLAVGGQRSGQPPPHGLPAAVEELQQRVALPIDPRGAQRHRHQAAPPGHLCGADVWGGPIGTVRENGGTRTDPIKTPQRPIEPYREPTEKHRDP